MKGKLFIPLKVPSAFLNRYIKFNVYDKLVSTKVTRGLFYYKLVVVLKNQKRQIVIRYLNEESAIRDKETIEVLYASLKYTTSVVQIKGEKRYYANIPYLLKATISPIYEPTEDNQNYHVFIYKDKDVEYPFEACSITRDTLENLIAFNKKESFYNVDSFITACEHLKKTNYRLS